MRMSKIRNFRGISLAVVSCCMFHIPGADAQERMDVFGKGVRSMADTTQQNPGGPFRFGATRMVRLPQSILAAGWVTMTRPCTT